MPRDSAGFLSRGWRRRHRAVRRHCSAPPISFRRPPAGVNPHGPRTSLRRRSSALRPTGFTPALLQNGIAAKTWGHLIGAFSNSEKPRRNPLIERENVAEILDLRSRQRPQVSREGDAKAEGCWTRSGRWGCGGSLPMPFQFLASDDRDWRNILVQQGKHRVVGVRSSFLKIGEVGTGGETLDVNSETPVERER